MKIPDHIEVLFQKYLSGAQSEGELQELLDHFERFGDQSPLRPLIGRELEREVADMGIYQRMLNALDVNIHQELENRRKQHNAGFRVVWSKWMTVAAAVVLIFFAAGLYYFSQRHIEGTSITASQKDIAPGRQGATLTLTSGKKIRLSDAASGELAREAGVAITKTATGELIYRIKDISKSSQSTNTLSTAKGETYQVVLPDGSKVWLNAASSLKYPAKFTISGKRMVQLDGEAYFEVAEDKAHPFVVEVRGQTVEVLGTEFNINAYREDALMRTTLAEGSVRLEASGKAVMLKPNQQAISGNGSITVKEVDAELALAWKTGFFLFDRESLEHIMTKISRWYDVEVVFNDPSLKSRTFTGTVSRFDKISQVFKMLQQSEAVKFTVEGKRIIIEKKK